ncbi:hypothetical protein JOM49_004391 [Amycolatopsis magusensis]|uniref:HTH cro/C1-type domain-containing protein n=1 Tax=Amycolatopsis magusensis TaxID=882444 RepID=A0ABS4PTW7_9PSEU|nr:hypothetical protein [Amycolatopsis magusensis]
MRADVARHQAAEILGCTPSKIGDLETARSRPKPAEVEALLNLYDVPMDRRASILALVRRGTGRRSRGAANEVEASPQLRRTAELEGQAVAAFYYSGEVIAPPLQVLSYAEALFACSESQPDRARRLANFQMTRRAHIDAADQPSLRYLCFLGEAALHVGIGGPATMLEQLTCLRALSVRLSHLEVRLVPFSAGSHPLLGGTTTLYLFKQPAPPRVISEAPEPQFADRRAGSIKQTLTSFDQLDAKAIGRTETVNRLDERIHNLRSNIRTVKNSASLLKK